MHYIRSHTKIFNLQVFFEGGVRFTCNKLFILFMLIVRVTIRNQVIYYALFVVKLHVHL